MNKITPFIMFPSRGKEAVDFYTSIFKDSKVNSLMTIPGSEQLLQASFSLEGQHYLAMDGGETFKFEQGISMFVSCNDQQEVDYYWAALTANGGEEGRCGWLKDQFGISWQIVPTALGELMGGSDHEKAGRVQAAMMKMNKLVIEDLRNA